MRRITPHLTKNTDMCKVLLTSINSNRYIIIYLFIHLFIKSPTEKGKTVTNLDLFYLLLVTKQFRKRLT